MSLRPFNTSRRPLNRVMRHRPGEGESADAKPQCPQWSGHPTRGRLRADDSARETELITMTVSGPPHKARNTSPTSCGVASPAFNGTIVRSGPSTVCRNGICTSTACSCAWVGALTIIAGAGAPGRACVPERNGSFDRQAQSLTLGCNVYRHSAQRRFKRRCRGTGDASHGHAVSRPYDYRASHAPPPTLQERVSERSCRAGIYVSGVRHYYRPRHPRWKCGLQLLQKLSAVIELLVD